MLFSTGGAAIKGNDLTPWQVASFRCAVAAATLLLVYPASRRGWSMRIVPPAAAYSATLILFALASRRTTAANAIFLQSTAPLYFVVLGPLLLHERLRRSDFLLLAGIGCGLAMLFAAPPAVAATAPDPATGNLLATASAFTWALTIAGLRWLGRGESGGSTPAAMVVLGNLMAFAFALPMALPVREIRPHDIAVVLFLGMFQIAAAYIALTAAMRRVPALEASTLLLLEPALNPFWTWLALGENPGAWAIAGGGVILLTTMLNTWWQNRAPDPATAI